MKQDKIAKYSRKVSLAAAVIVVVALAYFFTMYGSWSVLRGMDTMLEEYPPGATCIIQKRPGTVRRDNVVVIALPGGAALLTRVDRVDGDQIYIRHDNRESVFLHYEKQSYPMSDVRGLVLTALLPDPEDRGDPRGK